MKRVFVSAVLTVVTAGAALGAQITVSAAHADATPIGQGETVASGDRITVSMAVRRTTEKLGFVLFYRNGRVREFIESPEMPLELLPTKENPQIWSASFTLPYVSAPVRIPARALTVGVERYGADSHYDGWEYSAAPFPVALAPGENSGRLPEGVRIFDFGPDGASVYPSAESVSPAQTPADFTWRQRPQAYEAAHLRQLDALMHDWAKVSGDGKLSFGVRLPKGRYRVVAGIGAIGCQCHYTQPYLPTCGRLRVNGKTVFERRGGDGEAFRYLEHEAHEGEAFYETYLKPVISEPMFTVENADGELEFEFCSPDEGKNAVLDYVMLWPEGMAAGEAEYGKMQAVRRRHVEALWRPDVVFRRDLDPILDMADDPTAALVLCARENPVECILPASRPRRTEVGQPLKIRVAPGEKLSGAVLMRANRDLRGVGVTLEGLPAFLRGEVRKTVYQRFARAFGFVHKIMPNQLVPGKRDVRRDTSYGWMVRVNAPKDAKPAVYRGRLVAEAGDGTKAELPVEVTVLDVALPELADYRICAMDHGVFDMTEKHMRFAREELGATTIALFDVFNSDTKLIRDGNGKIVGCSRLGRVPTAEAARRFRIFSKMDFPCKEPFCGPMAFSGIDVWAIDGVRPNSPEWPEAVKAVHSTLLAVARSNGCETVVLDLGGEMGSPAGEPRESEKIVECVRYIDTVRRLCPEIKISYRCNCFTSLTNFYPKLDVVGVRHQAIWEESDRLSDFGRNKELYVYSCGGRFFNGLFGWYHGAKGSFREWLSWRHGVEYDDFLCQGICGGMSHTEGVPAPDGGFLPSIRSEAWRAATVDLQYLKLLDGAIADAKRNGRDCRRASEFRAALRSWVRDTHRYFLPWGSGGTPFRYDGNNTWPHLRLDLLREMCLAHAKALEGANGTAVPEFRTPVLDERAFSLWDGPLNRARTAALVGSFEVRKGVVGDEGEAVVEVLRDGKVLTRAIPGKADATYSYGGFPPLRRFVIDSSELGPGAYTMRLKLNGCRAGEFPFTLL